MAFLDKANRTLNDTTQKSRDLAEITRLNARIEDCEQKIGQLYAEIGKAYYEAHAARPGSDYAPQMEQIRDLSREIAECRDEIQRRRGNVKCPKCGEYVPYNTTFCTFCGSRVLSPDLMVCHACGSVISKNNLFCDRCGTRLQNITPPPESGLLCKCGTQLSPGAAFCPTCGTSRAELLRLRREVQTRQEPEQGTVPAPQPRIEREPEPEPGQLRPESARDEPDPGTIPGPQTAPQRPVSSCEPPSRFREDEEAGPEFPPSGRESTPVPSDGMTIPRPQGAPRKLAADHVPAVWSQDDGEEDEPEQDDAPGEEQEPHTRFKERISGGFSRIWKPSRPMEAGEELEPEPDEVEDEAADEEPYVPMKHISIPRPQGARRTLSGTERPDAEREPEPRSEAGTCPSCGFDLLETDLFCPRCGGPVRPVREEPEPEALQEDRCVHCGAKLLDSDLFCPVCGSAVKRRRDRTVPTPAAAGEEPGGSVPGKKICPNCGALQESSCLFCMVCGSKLNRD